MRKFLTSGPLLLIFTIMLFAGCTKPPVNNRLRPTSQTPDSREFFGCRINGIPYSPKGNLPASLGGCSYESVYNGDVKFIFKINGDRQESECRTFSVAMTLDSILLKEERTFILGTQGPQKNFGKYIMGTECSQERTELYTTDDQPGQLTITKFDPVKGIVAGTFAFVVVDEFGNVFRISDGVFDRYFIN